MPLELATNISELNQSWPLGEDSFKEGDDHLRLLKTVLKTTLPNIDGAITGTPESLNYLTDNQSALEAILDGSDTHRYIPSGVINMWAGDDLLVPTGWNLCDGTNGTPDLRDRFVLGSPDGTRGAEGTTHLGTSQSAGGHSHGGATNSHALTIGEIPSHTHGLRLMTSSTDGGEATTAGVQGDVNDLVSSYMNTNNFATATGGGLGHAHTINAEGDHTHVMDTRGKYYKLAFIMKA